MKLINDMERLIHLIARSIAKASGSENPDIYADTVLSHARVLADEKIVDPAKKSDEELGGPVTAPDADPEIKAAE